jgi:hypothetical protein
MVTGLRGDRISPGHVFDPLLRGFVADDEANYGSTKPAVAGYCANGRRHHQPLCRTLAAHLPRLRLEPGPANFLGTAGEQSPPLAGLGRRCPECEWASEGVHDEVAVDAFDEQLDLGSHELADELRALQHANMSEMADAFVIALWRDLIGADDFRV